LVARQIHQPVDIGENGGRTGRQNRYGRFAHSQAFPPFTVTQPRRLHKLGPAACRFWEATGPAIYFSVVRSIAGASGRESAQNGQLLAVAAPAMDDTPIAVFGAKYRSGKQLL
jgi:hypothetical protein